MAFDDHGGASNEVRYKRLYSDLFAARSLSVRIISSSLKQLLHKVWQYLRYDAGALLPVTTVDGCDVV